MTFSFFSNFSYPSVRNGQVQKALFLRTELQKLLGNHLTTIDTGGHEARILRLLVAYRKSSAIIVSLGKKGIFVFALLTFLLQAITPAGRRPRLFYFVVGGWIADSARRSSAILRFLRNCEAVFVEVNPLAKELSAMGVRAIVFPNFRSTVVAHSKTAAGSPLKLCFCSRIRADKGALLAIDLVRALRASGIEAALDFHGPIDDDFAEEFNSAVGGDGIRYMGTYDSEREAVHILSKYDFMVLPTSYAGECMPGAVIESFCAATPVITSDWRFMMEIVDHERNGLVLPLGDFTESACKAIVRVMQEGLYETLSQQCLEDAHSRYSVGVAETLLRQHLCIDG
jgi:glycosyltransferase involved in cell wall biosynthesis